MHIYNTLYDKSWSVSFRNNAVLTVQVVGCCLSGFVKICTCLVKCDVLQTGTDSTVELVGGSRPFAQHVLMLRGSKKGDWSNWFYTVVVRGLLTSSQINMGLKLQPNRLKLAAISSRPRLWPCFSSVMTEQFELSQTPLWAREHWLMLFVHISNAL